MSNHQTFFVLGLVIVCVALAVFAVFQYRQRLRLIDAAVTRMQELRNTQAELAAVKQQLKGALEALAAKEQPAASKSFKKLVDLLVACGVTGLIFASALYVSGWYGGAAVTSALASIGFPYGMIGGIALLILVTAVLAKYPPLDVAMAVLKGLLAKMPRSQLIAEIEGLPRIFPQRFRRAALDLIDEHAG